jgi:cephalosporin hydroxylase
MRILAITSKQSGVGYHRIMMPLVNMKKDYCLITDTLSEETFEGKFDIVVMNRMLANIKPEQMIEWRKKYGFKFVVDNDDYWHLEPSHILYQDYILKKIR